VVAADRSWPVTVLLIMTDDSGYGVFEVNREAMTQTKSDGRAASKGPQYRGSDSWIEHPSILRRWLRRTLLDATDTFARERLSAFHPAFSERRRSAC
jgi:hypothetical protein